MKQLTITLLLLQNFFAFSQPTVLQPGDITLIGFNFTNPDEFSFVSFVNLNPGTIIYFTDSGWKNDQSFREGEGLISYTVPAEGKKAMEVITYPNADFTTMGINGFFGFSTDGDQLFIFQGSMSAPAFLFGMDSSDNPWIGDAVDNNTSALPDVLAESGMHVQFHQVLNAVYDCSIKISPESDLQLQSVTGISNWSTSPNRFLMPSSCFNNTLPISLIDFNIEGSNVSFGLISGEETVVYLEESEDGEHFYKIDSITTDIGYHYYRFTTIIENKYYRLWIKNEANVFYSRILSTKAEAAKPAEVILYSVYGIVHIQKKGDDIRREDLACIEHGVYLIKKLYENGSFVVEKVIIDKNNY